jgi:hypothetical protein
MAIVVAGGHWIIQLRPRMDLFRYQEKESGTVSWHKHHTHHPLGSDRTARVSTNRLSSV